MSLFDFIESKRKSNTTLERLELLEHWKNPVILLMKKKDPIIDGVIEICLTKQSVNERIAMIPDKSEFTYCQTTCIQAVHAVLNRRCDGLSIHGLAKEELYISKRELEEIKEPVDAIITMMAIISEVVEKKKAFYEMSEMRFYMLGELPELSAEGENNADIDVMQTKEGKEEAVKLFIRKEHAIEANTRNFPISHYRFAHIVSYLKGSYAVVIEPYEEYRVEFSKQELSDYVTMA